MVVVIAMSGVLTGILAAVLAALSGVSLLGVILAYCLTGTLAATFAVVAIAMRPVEVAAEHPRRNTQTV
jgi:uncharacterized oligopeptide transporter (OPT) family protein